MRNVVILPIQKTREWWERSAVERHAYFYPHADGATGARARGHALRDERQNPEWRFVVEGPEWRGRRVLKW